MCLKILRNSEPIIAEQDIEVYKLLYADSAVVVGIDLSSLHGKEYKGIVKYDNKKLKVEGKLTVEGGLLYLCQNKKELNGSTCDEKHGYKNSWVLDDDVRSIIVDGKEITSKGFRTIYQKAVVAIGETYTSNLVEDDGFVEVGLHSYAGLINANSDKEDRMVVVKCIIPKGSSYYFGNFGIHLSYASDKLKYVEIIK